MARLTFVFGVVMILLGVVSYFVTGRESVTALIPAFFGIVFVALGFVMRDPAKVKHAGHAAALLALIGLAGSGRGVPSLITMLQGGEVARPQAAVAQSVMVVLCVVFIALAIKSFVDARRAQAAQA